MASLGQVALHSILKITADSLHVGRVVLNAKSRQQTSRRHSGLDLDGGHDGSENGE